MALNEILLILAVIVVLTISHFLLKKVKQPASTYIRLSAGVLLLILVWFFAPGSSIAIKVLMSTIVVSSLIKTINDYFNFQEIPK